MYLFILGGYLLVQTGGRLYFGLGISKLVIQLYIHIASPVPLGSKTVLKPQSATVCTGRIKDSGEIPSGELYAVSAMEKVFMGNQAGLMVSNSIAKMPQKSSLPIFVVNSTNQTVSLSKGCLIAQVEPVISSRIERVINLVKKNGDGSEWDMDVDLPSNYKPQIQTFLRKKGNLFASLDSDLGHTDTVAIKIDTGNNTSINLRQYRTPILNRQVNEETIEEMVDAKIVCRSKSPLSFPVVIVDK